MHHTGGAQAATPEGRIIHFADRIAYINHDIDDAIRGGLMRREDIPQPLRSTLGETHGRRIDTLVTAMIDYGEREREIGMDAEILDAMLELRKFMFSHVYTARLPRPRKSAPATCSNRFIFTFSTISTSFRPITAA